MQNRDSKINKMRDEIKDKDLDGCTFAPIMMT